MATQMPMQTPQDLFVHELSSILSAEQIITQMLSEAQGLVQDSQVRQGLQQHERETQQQIQNLQQVLQQLGAQPHPVECHAMKGLVQELHEAQQANPSPEVLQGLVVACAAKTEHFEIAAYTGLVKKAAAMGQREIAGLLQQNLQQEQAMLQQVEAISDTLTQRMATQMGSTESQAASAL